MKYIRLKTTDPYYNLAVEEYLFRYSEDDVFMLWQNSPTVVVGKNQNIYAEVDLDYATAHGINVSRRITGGGAVFHDLGNINYSFISVSGKNQALDFEYFTRPIRNALAALGTATTLSGRNDIECDGRKISGSAQYASSERILHHGTLLFNADSEAMEAVLKVDKEKLAHKAVKSCRARVVNLNSLLGTKLTVEEFISEIESRVCAELNATQAAPPEDEIIDSLYSRNKSYEWIYSERRYLTGYTVGHKKKYPFGIVAADMELERGVIASIVISGDFFGVAPIEELEKKLVGKSPDELFDVDPAPYIAGMSREELTDLLRGV